MSGVLTMRILILLWMALMASVFFAGLGGFLALIRKPSLHRMAWRQAGDSAEGFVLLVGLILLVHSGTLTRSTSARLHVTPGLIYLWLWLAVRAFSAVMAWLFVLETTGKIRRWR